MSVFTVYCHGTGFNSHKSLEKDELVGWFHSHTEGVEATLAGSLVTAGSYMINQGPGHGGSGGIVLPQQVNPMTGNMKTNQGTRGGLFNRPRPTFADSARGHTGGQSSFANLKGGLAGEGWDENVLRTVNIIQDLKFEKGQDIDVVNLVGWSRGAVTCIRIAHKLYEVFGNSITCNIFAVDPVAGMDKGETMLDTRVLQSNVGHYVGILSMHERRRSFSPQDWSRMAVDPAVTTAILLPMPGVHSAQVIPGSPVESALVTRNLACAFLTRFGTRLTATPYANLGSPVEMSLAYARLVVSLSEHVNYQTKGLKNRLMGLGLRRREFAKHSKMDAYIRGGKGSYWINEHHRACFAKAFPAGHHCIFESAWQGEADASMVDVALTKALDTFPSLRQSLVSKGLMTGDGPYMLGIGAGRYPNQLRISWPDTLDLHA